MNKKLQLEKIAKEIEECRVCQEGKSGKAVPGEGDPDASVVFVGEAPGKLEAKTGRPFVGRSGKYLRSLIKKIGLEDNGVFITSPVKYLPARGTPSRKDIEHGKKHLNDQLKIIQPKIFVLLGSVAQRALLDKVFPVLKDHGKIIEKESRKYFLTLHPAAAIRFPKYKALIKNDFLKLRNLIKE